MDQVLDNAETLIDALTHALLVYLATLMVLCVAAAAACCLDEPAEPADEGEPSTERIDLYA